MCSVQENSSSRQHKAIKVRKIMLQFQLHRLGAYSERCMREQDHFAVFTASLQQLVFFSSPLVQIRMNLDKLLLPPHLQETPQLAHSHSCKSRSQAGPWMDGWNKNVDRMGRGDGWRGTMIRCVPHTMIKASGRLLLR
jgi:hypothetical protein